MGTSRQPEVLWGPALEDVHQNCGYTPGNGIDEESCRSDFPFSYRGEKAAKKKSH
jgi:hypothetical protein